MALEYLREERALSLRGAIALTDGTEHALSTDNIIRYAIDESSTAGESITLGDARAADYTLQIEDAEHVLTAALLIGAQVTMEIGLEDEYSPLGVWYIDRATISRQSATATISGSDALGSKLDGLYADGSYPATLGAIAQRVADQAGLALKSAEFRNADISVSAQPEWDTATNSLRATIGYIAGCAGGFARMDRAGQLEIVPYAAAEAETITADYFTTLSVGGGQSFAFNCLQVAHYGTNIYTRYAIDSTRTDTAGDTLRISDNPLMTAAIAQTLVEALTGLTGSALDVDWVGDPTILPGAHITVQDTDGSTHTGIITRQYISLDGGLHAQTSADLPENIESTFAEDTLFTPSGRVNIEAIQGKLEVWAQDQIALGVGGIEIGGRNLLRNSGVQVETAEYGMADYAFGSDAPQAGDTVTVRIWGALGDGKVEFGVYNSGGNVRALPVLTDNGDGTYSATGAWNMVSSSGVVAANTYLRVYQRPSSVSGVTSTITKIKLERGNKATDWTPAPEDSASGLDTGDEGVRVQITSSAFNVDVPGDSGDTRIDSEGMSVPKISSASVQPRYDGPTSLTVNPSATPDGVSTFRSLSDAFSALNGRAIPSAVGITVTADCVETGVVELGCTTGAQITVKASGSTLVTITGRLLCHDVTNRVNMTYVGFSYAGADEHVAYVHGCSFVSFYRCAFTGAGSSNSYACVCGDCGSHVRVEGCALRGYDKAFYLYYMATGLMRSCTGSDINTALAVATGARLSAAGTIPAYTSAQSYNDGTGILTLASSVSAGSSSGSAPTTTGSTTLSATDTRTNYGSSWYGTSSRQLSQGIAQGVTFTGAMWFDASALSGKTAVAAALRLVRLSGVGAGSTVSVCIGTMSNASASGSLASVATYGAIGTVDQGGTLKVSIPAAAAQALIDGTAKGLYIYSTDTGYWGERTYSRNYAQFAGYGSTGAPQLAISYTG